VRINATRLTRVLDEGAAAVPEEVADPWHPAEKAAEPAANPASLRTSRRCMGMEDGV